jgi:hypothetical protein
MLRSIQTVKGKIPIALGAGVARAVAALATPAVFSVLLVACSGARRSDVTAVADGGGGLDAKRADGGVGIADTSLPGDETLPGDAFVAQDGASADGTGGGAMGESGSLDAPPVGDAAGSSGPEGATGEASVDAAGPSFAVVYQTVFQPSCITGCHSATTPMGNLDLSTRDGAYASLVGVLASGSACAFTAEKRVAVGNPATSLLYTKMVDLEDCGGPMPSLPLDPGSVELVRAWIANGAAK